MEIVAALFIENINVRQLSDGGPTRIDLSGIQFSLPAPQPVPVTITPHLVVLVRAPADTDGNGTLETVFVLADGSEVGRNAQSFFVEPGKFGYRLVKGELDFSEPGTIEAKCTILESGSSVTVPLTALPNPA